MAMPYPPQTPNFRRGQSTKNLHRVRSSRNNDLKDEKAKEGHIFRHQVLLLRRLKEKILLMTALEQSMMMASIKELLRNLFLVTWKEAVQCEVNNLQRRPQWKITDDHRLLDEIIPFEKELARLTGTKRILGSLLKKCWTLPQCIMEIILWH